MRKQALFLIFTVLVADLDTVKKRFHLCVTHIITGTITLLSCVAQVPERFCCVSFIASVWNVYFIKQHTVWFVLYTCSGWGLQCNDSVCKDMFGEARKRSNSLDCKWLTHLSPALCSCPRNLERRTSSSAGSSCDTPVTAMSHLPISASILHKIKVSTRALTHKPPLFILLGRKSAW